MSDSRWEQLAGAVSVVTLGTGVLPRGLDLAGLVLMPAERSAWMSCAHLDLSSGGRTP